MNFIEFKMDKPESFIYPEQGLIKCPDGAGAILPLPEGNLLFLRPALVESVEALRLVPGEEFSICLYHPRGDMPHWEVWLMPSTEKARAKKELEEANLESQLKASIQLVASQKKGLKSHSREGDGSSRYLAATGTEGARPVSTPALLPAQSRKRGPGPIPLNVAFREIVKFVVRELNESGEQWSDSSRQDLVSTVMISAQKAGLLGVWEREEAA